MLRMGTVLSCQHDDFVEVLPLPASSGPDRLITWLTPPTDAEGLRKYLAAQEADVPASVEHGFDGSLWFHVKDREGNVVGFVQPPAHPAAIMGADLSATTLLRGYECA